MHPRSFITAGTLLLLVLGCREDTQSPTEPATPRPQASVSATAAPAFTQVSAGTWHTCGLTTGGQVYCWGANFYGELGDGTTEAHVSPTLVASGLLFRQVSAGQAHTCAVTRGNRAYCWGANGSGQLGDGTTVEMRFTPVPVAGSRAFRQVSAKVDRTCALTTSTTNKIYCWGTGILGNGSGYTTRRTPQLVSEARMYRQVSVGNDHTCGVSTTYKVLCWGYNKYGQLGNGAVSSFIAVNPVAVAGTRQYLQVSAGTWHTCAVTTTNRAYCWGHGRSGEIGDGKTYLRFTPRAVAGGLSFDRVSAGAYYTCGETTGNRAYCWGSNWSGQLGDGTNTYQRLTPTPVAGGFAFKQVDAGNAEHTCGVASGSVALCWGGNGMGQLGNGTEGGTYLSPTRVQ